MLELTPEDRVKSDETSFETEETKSFFTVKYPKEDVITSQQTAYIKDFFDEFESVLFSGNLADEINGYVKYIDVPSFIDHILLSECFHQLDGLRSSQYFYKKKNGKLFMGPVWDFNRSLGNVEYYKIYEYDMWWMLNSRGNERVPYVNQLMKDPLFAKQYADQWFELRQGLLHNDNMLSRIDGYADEINEAQTRNFERWPDMLAHSYNQVYTFNSYDQAVQQVKDWLINKMEWLDQGFEDYSTNTYLSNNDFTSFAFEKQTSDFKIEFDWSPQNENMDGVFGLADISSGIDWYTDLACITRFNPDGEIDARNEGAYMNDNAINYTVGEYYHVKMEVDINTHTYDLFVTPSSTDVEIQVAESYGFRSEQSGVEQINGFVMISPSGSYKLKNFCLNEECSIVGVPLIAEKDLPTITSYPNPFTESIHLTLEQKEHLMINLNIYGSDGKLLSQIHNGKLNKGIHEFKWGKNDLNGKELAQGIYFCRFAANGISKTIKIVKIK